MTDEEIRSASSKHYIDVFMEGYYQKIHDRLRPNDRKLNSRGKSVLDILNDTVEHIYNSMAFTSQQEADSYLSSKFRVKMKKPRPQCGAGQ